MIQRSERAFGFVVQVFVHRIHGSRQKRGRSAHELAEMGLGPGLRDLGQLMVVTNLMPCCERMRWTDDPLMYAEIT